jgi:hypothetical protein
MKAAPDDSITIAKAYELYPDEWVLMEITRDHNDYRKAKGRVLAHAAQREELDTPYRSFREQHPRALTFEFFAGDLVPRDVSVVL